MLSHVFTTPISRAASDLTAEQLAEAVRDLRGRRAGDEGERRSNQGGWHSSGNLFASQQGAVWNAVQGAVTRALFDYIGAVFNYTGEVKLSLVAWAVINGAGDFNMVHNHAAHLLSGALYLSVPAGMRGGEIYFQDPRLNLNAHETEQMLKQQILPPWRVPGIPVIPKEGEILVFPSWLMHAVHPFTADDPQAERIVLSFNARV